MVPTLTPYAVGAVVVYHKIGPYIYEVTASPYFSVAVDPDRMVVLGTTATAVELDDGPVVFFSVHAT